MPTLAAAGRVLVDGHVHFHDCFDAATFFHGAVGNFEAAARVLGLPASTPGFLLFTESSWDHSFRAFRDEPEGFENGGFRFARTAEAESLLALCDGEIRLVLVAGRQVVTSEGLEVLALGTDREFPDGLPIREALAAVQASDALAAIPWGFGKWTFARRALVGEILEESGPGELFLGDNAGRPALASTPRFFRRADEKGIGILPGTDPLPFARQNQKAGSYGFVLEAGLDEACPAKAVKSAIRRGRPPLASYGSLEGIAAFCRDQIGMQRRKHSSGGSQ